MMISDEELIQVASRSYSVSDLMKNLGLVPMGGNHKLYKDRVRRLSITFKPRPVESSPKRPLSDYLTLDGPKCTSSQLRKRLISVGLKKNECEECGQGPIWNGKPLSFHLEHKNGNHYDNRFENLQILCPNCHTQTPTYGALKREGKAPPRPKSGLEAVVIIKKNGGRFCKCGVAIYKRGTSGLCKRCYQELYPPSVHQKVILCECGAEIRKRNKHGLCLKCYDIKFPRPRKVLDRPSLEVLQADIQELGYSGTGRKYGVSDNAIRKWLKVLSHPN